MFSIDGFSGRKDRIFLNEICSDRNTNYLYKMDKQFIFIVDDWNGKEAKAGTMEAIEQTELKTIISFNIGDDKDSDRYGWWNGFGIFALEKS